ncbi:HAD-superfamily hydrolase, partial [Lichtheimia hyalospora FSU 10163]
MSLTKAAELVQTLLRNPTVRIKNIEATTQKLGKILQDGTTNLHFISDFDMTMSSYWVRNQVTDALERNPSCHGVPARYSKMTDEFRKASDKLVKTYYPIEINQKMTVEERLPYMIEWWQKAHNLMIEQKLTRDDLRGMAKEAHIVLRPRVETVLSMCHNINVPFLVFSAGIGNVIDEVLKEKNLLYPNMHIVSNMMQFNEQDVCDSFADPLIHVFNKSEFQLETTPYYNSIEQRSNVILMGDSLGDLKMSKGVKHDLCLNIGFCNHDWDSTEELYTEAFDIVIMRDANFAPVVDILETLE